MFHGEIVCRNWHLNKPCHDGKERVSVMKKIFVIFFISLLLTCFYISPVMSQATSSSNLKAFYAAYIDDCIIKCESLAKLRNSRSEKLRQAAEMHCQMAQFFKTQKAALVDDMILADLGNKKYKIHYYLNKEFYEAYRSHSVPSNC